MLGTGKWEQRGRQSNLLRVSMAGMELRGCSGAVNSSLPLARQCHGVSLLLLSPNIGSDPKLGTFERKGNTGGCSGLGVKGFKRNTEQPEGLSARPQPAQLKPQLRNSSQMPRE